jgi:hypothetical protein
MLSYYGRWLRGDWLDRRAANLSNSVACWTASKQLDNQCQIVCTLLPHHSSTIALTAKLAEQSVLSSAPLPACVPCCLPVQCVCFPHAEPVHVWCIPDVCRDPTAQLIACQVEIELRHSCCTCAAPGVPGALRHWVCIGVGSFGHCSVVDTEQCLLSDGFTCNWTN